MALKDYYAILGVSRNADADAIKKAYKKLAMKEHPDRGGDEAKFKEIGEAFAVLSDETKRAEYDDAKARGFSEMPGTGGMPRGGPGGPGQTFSYSFGGDVDPHEIFRAFFGGGGLGGMGGMGGMSGMSGMSGMGGMPGMGGIGGMPGGMSGMSGMGIPPGAGMRGMGEPPRTRQRSGSGPQFSSLQPPPVVTHELRLSLEELATGCTKKMRVTRKRAGRPESTVLEIKVVPGWKAGTKITFPGEGDQVGGPGTPAGDICFVVAEKPHARFKRVGNDLEYHTRATLKDVIRGFEVSAPHLLASAPPLRAKLDQVQLEGSRQVIRFPGRGMPAAKGGKPGDAVLVVDFAIPKLSAAQREQICEALDNRMDTE